MVKLSRVYLLLALAAACGTAAPAAAQVPNIGFVFPPGGKVGSQPTVNIGGGSLQGATAVLLSGQGVAAKITKNTEGGSLPVELSIAPDAVPGMRELRVVTPRGTSNAGRVWVGSYDEQNETEPNNTLATAQKLARLPITVNGQANGAEDLDSFTFEAGAGETFVFDLVAARMHSALDGYLLLLDSRGKSLAYAQEGFDRDPRVIHTFKTAGTYTVQVRDTLFRNGTGYTYKLTMGKIPALTGYLPVGGRRGEKVELQVHGVNLGDMKSVTVQIPMTASPSMVAPPTPGGPLSSPIMLVPSDMDELVESEPNDSVALAQGLFAPPVVVNGRIDRPGELDLYRFKPDADGTLTFDLWSRRIGSRIEPEIRVLDSAGKELAKNDDADGKDSRLNLAVKAGTEYLVEVRSLDQSAGGEAYYRLQIAPPTGPDFRLTVTPDEVNVGQGGSALVTVTAARTGGFGGAIDLRVEGLPAGITTSPLTIPAGVNALNFTVTAPAGAAPGAMSHIRIVGAATVNNSRIERAAQPVEVYTPPLAPANATANRPCEIFVATVMPAEAYSLQLDAPAKSVKKGTQGVEIKVKATRLMGQTGAIALTVVGQPGNVTPVIQPIAANTTEIVLKLNVAANAPAGTSFLVITGDLGKNLQVAPIFVLTITD